jgi:hypothetical protein
VKGLAPWPNQHTKAAPYYQNSLLSRKIWNGKPLEKRRAGTDATNKVGL